MRIENTIDEQEIRCYLRRLTAYAVTTVVDKGGAGGPAPPPNGRAKKTKGAFLSHVQHVYLYSLFN